VGVGELARLGGIAEILEAGLLRENEELIKANAAAGLAAPPSFDGPVTSAVTTDVLATVLLSTLERLGVAAVLETPLSLSFSLDPSGRTVAGIVTPGFFLPNPVVKDYLIVVLQLWNALRITTAEQRARVDGGAYVLSDDDVEDLLSVLGKLTTPAYRDCQGRQEFNNVNDKFQDENGDFIVNLDCCNNNCEQQCPCYEDVRPRVCCENPCIDGALPLLTKCGLKYKKQLQHGITLVNPCQVIYPNPCPTQEEINVGARRSVSVKGYNKKYSFQEQLLLLKSNAYANSVNTYDCNRFVKVNNQVRCQPRTGTCPTNNCF